MDWREEIGAEVMSAVIQAARDFDPERGVPWTAFLRQRIMHSAVGRYRREWRFAFRRVSPPSLEECGVTAHSDVGSVLEARGLVLRNALDRLPKPDAGLIEHLFWEGKTEASYAKSLGISQQAVSKKKRKILALLSKLLRSDGSLEFD
jgi:RNA polymerase sigma factor (sigma-70 family)